MSTATREQVVRWMIEVDDPLELLRVNWHRHDPFTQVGMWDITDDTEVRGIRLMMESDEGFKGFVLDVYDAEQDEASFVAIATYFRKCPACGAQPHDSMWYVGDGYTEEGLFQGNQIDAWATMVIHGMWENAREGIEWQHADGCAVAVAIADDEPSEVVDAEA